jgi:hypothetical protein
MSRFRPGLISAYQLQQTTMMLTFPGFCQGWNRMEITLNLSLMGHTARVIKPLDEATAIKTGLTDSRSFCSACLYCSKQDMEIA